MKKILSLLLAGLVIFSLCACQIAGSEVSSKPDSGEVAPSETSSLSQQVTLDAALTETDEGAELIKFVKAFSQIPVGYLSTVDKDHTAFKDRRDFKDVAPLDMAIFICNYLESNNLLWSNYQGKFGYEGYTVPVEDLNMYAKKLFGYEYDFSKIKETNGFGKIYKYIEGSRAFDVRVFGSAFANGACEYKGISKKVSESEYQAEFVIWENEEGEKPDGVEGKDWYLDDRENYWEYDDTFVLTVKKIDGEWKYVSFIEM